MKRLMRCMCLVLALSLCLSSIAFAEKQESTSGTYSYYFTSYGAWIAKVGGHTFEIAFDVIGRDIMDEIGASSIQVQRSTNGTSGWATIRTYDSESYSYMMGSNTGAHGECVYYTATSGYYYRAYVTFCASNGNGAGYVSAYSNVLKI